MLHRTIDSHGNLLNNERKMVEFAIKTFEKYSIHGANTSKEITISRGNLFSFKFWKLFLKKSGNYFQNVRNTFELGVFITLHYENYGDLFNSSKFNIIPPEKSDS